MTSAAEARDAVEVVRVDEPDAALVASVVRVHRDAFPRSALTVLGPEMTRRYYRSLWSGPHDSVTLVARDGSDRLLGFLVGGTFRGSTIGFLSAQRTALVGAVLRNPRALASPVVWRRIGPALRLLWERRGGRGAPGPERPAAVPPASFGVLSVAVDPALQRRGIGGLLLDDAIAVARDSGYASVHLTADEGPSAEPFYLRRGFGRRLEDDGSWAGRMHLDLGDRPGADGEAPS